MSESPFSLAGKVAVVVGGTAGIGRAISLSLAGAGADVVASGRRQAIVDAVAAELGLKGRATLRVVSDVCNRNSLEELLQQTLQKFGKVDILVNSAAKIVRAPTLSFPEEAVGTNSGYKFDRHAAGLSDIWEAYAGAQVWSHY